MAAILEEKPVLDQAARDKLFAELPGKVAEAVKHGRPLLHHCMSSLRPSLGRRHSHTIHRRHKGEP